MRWHVQVDTSIKCVCGSYACEMLAYIYVGCCSNDFQLWGFPEENFRIPGPTENPGSQTPQSYLYAPICLFEINMR